MVSVPRLQFLNGESIPLLGFGTWQMKHESIDDAIAAAVDCGYRHFDAAYGYENEELLGHAFAKVFKSGKVKREDLFITTKLPPHGMRGDLVKHFLQKSLKNLQLDYVDLYLVHTSMGLKYLNDDTAFPKDKEGNMLLDYETNHQEIWKGMEEIVDLGLAKSIGISNFNSKQIQRLIDNCRIKPVNLQVECHLYLQQNELVEFCQKHGIIMTAYAPLGTPGTKVTPVKKGIKNFDINLMEDSVVVSLAKKYKKSPTQILLRYTTQRKVVAIPKSVTPSRIQENIQIFDFELSEEDMKALKSQNRDLRILAYSFFEGKEGRHPEFPF